MEKIKYEVAAPKASALIYSLRSFGYSLTAAIADIIDNSVAAGANRIETQFNIDNPENPWISITDNGKGMNEEELQNAMRLGSTHPKDERAETDLGRFGLGLKTAAFSLCKRLTVISKSENDADYHVRTWDLDLVDKTNDWILTLEGSETAEGMAEAFFAENDHGTVVLMEKLDRLIPSDMDVKKINDYFLKCIESVEEKTTLYFSEFMDGKNKIDFYINGSLVKSWDPFYTSHKLTIINPEERLHFKGETIRVQSYILPHSSKLSDEELEEGGLNNNWTDLQGFYVYRNNRLLVAGEWLLEGLVKRDIYKLARIRIDLPNNLDEEWGIDVRKSIVAPPVQLQEQLRRIANAARKKSGEIYNLNSRPNYTHIAKVF